MTAGGEAWTAALRVIRHRDCPQCANFYRCEDETIYAVEGDLDDFSCIYFTPRGFETEDDSDYVQYGGATGEFPYVD